MSCGDTGAEDTGTEISNVRFQISNPSYARGGSIGLMAREIDLRVGIQQRNDADDDTRPEGNFQDADAVGDFLVAPFRQTAVDFVELAIDARLDFIELLIEIRIGGFLDPIG